MGRIRATISRQFQRVRHDPKRICELAARGESAVAQWYNGPTWEQVSRRLGCTPAAARAFILQHLATLTVAAFAHRSEDEDGEDVDADVYALYDADDRGWYVKVAINDQGTLEVYSFHPPRGPVRTRTGVVNVKREGK